VDAAIQLRRAGVQTHPGDPRLLEACQAGLTEGELAAAIEAYPGKPIGYVLAAVASTREKASQTRQKVGAASRPGGSGGGGAEKAREALLLEEANRIVEQLERDNAEYYRSRGLSVAGAP